MSGRFDPSDRRSEDLIAAIEQASHRIATAITQGFAHMADAQATALADLSTAIANIADNASGSPLTNLYLSLHTASPGIGGSQTTNEVTVGAYPNYARIPVARASGAGGWDVSVGAAVNHTLAAFAQSGAGTGATITHVAIGTASSGTGKVLYAGSLNSPLAVANLIQPQFQASQLTCTES